MRIRTPVLVCWCLLCLLAVAGGVTAEPYAQTSGPTTNGTVGYVDGYWHNDTLPVDDRSEPVVSESELDAVIARSMARVEVIRGETFERSVPVEVMPRDEFQAAGTDLFLNVTDTELRRDQVLFEALFMVGQDENMREAYEALYGDAVSGYYDPATDQIVVIAENTSEAELDEITLGHELVHALQDQRFDLESIDRSTIDRGLAANGLIEGEAVHIDRVYQARCRGEWSCLPPADIPSGGSYNSGLFLILFHPYSDGPAYVSHLLDGGNWSAIDAAFDDPPTTSSEVIRPGTTREPANVSVSRDGSEDWEPMVVDGRTTQTVGEAAMAAMAMYRSLEGTGTVLSEGALSDGGGTYNYNHDVTRGWAGDEFVALRQDVGSDETAFVWRSEWINESSAELFASAYLVMLDGLGAESVEDRSDTYTLSGPYSGAYYIDHDGTTVTLVRAPSVGELSAVREGAAPVGPDTTTMDPIRERMDSPLLPDLPISAGGIVVAALIVAGVLIVVAIRRNQ